MHFLSEDVYLHNGSIIEHIHPFKDMNSGGAFEEMIINLTQKYACEISVKNHSVAQEILANLCFRKV